MLVVIVEFYWTLMLKQTEASVVVTGADQLIMLINVVVTVGGIPQPT